MTLPQNCHVKYSGRAEWLDERHESPRDWLRTVELAELGRLRDPLRRQQWMAGRRLGKQLIGEIYGCAMADVQILTRDEQQLSVRPRVFVGAKQLASSLSISHNESGVLAVLAATDQWSVGVDLVGDVPCNPGFLQLWFTAGERSWLAQGTRQRTALLWGLKEAAYKACNSGERWMPQAIELLPQEDGAFQCLYRGEMLHDFCNHAWNLDGQLAVFASVPRVPHKSDNPISWNVCNSTPASNREAIAVCS